MQNYTQTIVQQRPMSNNIIPGRSIPQPGAPPRNGPPANKIKRVYLQKTTKNKSFLDMHHYLKAIGIKNNAFMLTLLDSDLDGIDPHDPNLNVYYKQKVLRECLCNYWYFLREVVRLPSMGSKPMMYKLTRGNLALSFCQMLNLNIFYEAPRLNLILYYSNIVLKTILELLENAKALMPKWSRKTETSLRMDYAEIKARDGAKV